MSSNTYLYINLRRSRDGAFVRVCVRSCVIVTLDSFSSLWAAFTLCTSTHCQYNEIVHRKQQHTSGIIHVYFFEPMKSTRLACLRWDSRYNISLFDNNHFIGDTSPLFCAQSSHGSPSQMCMFNKRRFDYNRLLFTPFLTV